MPFAVRTFALAVAATVALAACTTDPFTREQKPSNTATAGAAGAAMGAAAGAGYSAITMLDSNPRNDVDPRVAILAGAAAGLLAGLIAGARMDEQEAQLREELEATGVSVTRRGDNIVLNMDRALQFRSGATEVSPEGRRVLRSVALTLVEFDRTLVDVLGFTDNRGAASANQRISERRALNAAKVLVDFGVDGNRLAVAGRGETEPVASNDLPEGRDRNRRVEIHIKPLT